MAQRQLGDVQAWAGHLSPPGGVAPHSSLRSPIGPVGLWDEPLEALLRTRAVQADPKAGEDGSRRLADDVLLTELSDVFALLYDTCLRLANRTVRDSLLAEEVVQEAFLAAWQHAPARFDPARGPLAVWLMTLTRHKAVDAVRRAERTRRLQRRQEALPHQEVDDASPEELVLRRQVADRVREALRTLPVAQQRVLLMSYWGGLSQSQIARQDGTPLGTVKTRTGAGLVRLRGLLGPEAGQD